MDAKTIIRLAGGPAVVGAHFGISSQAVSQWEQIPADRCIGLEELTLKHGVTRHQMRADVFGPAPSKQEAA